MLEHAHACTCMHKHILVCLGMLMHARASTNTIFNVITFILLNLSLSSYS